jgi:hypothetical protein
MATISIDIPNGTQVARFIAAFAGTFQYQDQIPDPNNPVALIPNPETKAAFAQRMLRKMAKDVIKQWEGNLAQAGAFDAAVAKVENEITIT